MKFKEFSKWCNDRCFDGCWGIKEAVICSNICQEIYKLPFWKREKAWKEHEEFIINNIVQPIDKMIHEKAKENTDVQ